MKPIIKHYTERTWQGTFTRMVNGSPVMTVVYSGYADRESAEYGAARASSRYDDVVVVDVTPVDHVYEYEYCGDNVYDRYRWHLDGTFSAEPGQEVTPEIYADMLNALPPLTLPQLPETQDFCAGFLVGEPYHHERGKAHYAAFGKREGRYYFLGYLPAR